MASQENPTSHENPTVLHMAPGDAWADALAEHANTNQAEYVDPSLDAEGFIHCSTRDQLLIPANERFSGRTDLVVLVIDLRLVPAETVFEDCYETGQAFPHIYGPIPVAAVAAVVPFPCQPDGTFVLPPELAAGD